MRMQGIAHNQRLLEEALTVALCICILCFCQVSLSLFRPLPFRFRFRCLSLPFPPRVAPGRTRSAWLTAKWIGAWRVTGGYVVEIAGGSCEGGKKMDNMGGVCFLSLFFLLSFVWAISRPF